MTEKKITQVKQLTIEFFDGAKRKYKIAKGMLVTESPITLSLNDGIVRHFPMCNIRQWQIDERWL